MTGEDTARALILTTFLVVIASSLIARRLPLGQMARMAAGWIAIFAVAFAIFVFRDEFGRFGSRLAGGLDPEAGRREGETLRVPMAPDGHFWVRGTVNGSEVRFLVDSGATTTALSRSTVRAGDLESRSRFPTILETANGSVRAERVTIDRLVIGGIRRDDVAAVTADAFGETNVLGMNFLSSLGRWGVEGRTLVLEP